MERPIRSWYYSLSEKVQLQLSLLLVYVDGVYWLTLTHLNYVFYVFLMVVVAISPPFLFE
jgi:hypothetical protein